MNPRLTVFAILGCLAIVCAAVAVGVLILALQEHARQLPETEGLPVDIVTIFGGLAVMVIVLAVIFAALAMEAGFVRQMVRTIRDLETILHGNPDHRAAEGPPLKELAKAVNALADKAGEAHRALEDVRQEARRSAESQRRRLEAILRDLREGLIVCNVNHQILLYNHQALRLVGVSEEIGLGRSLFSILASEPLIHTFQLLRLQHLDKAGALDNDGISTVVVPTADGRRILQARMGLILDGGSEPQGYVLAASDVTEDLAALGMRDRLLRESTEDLRQPVANLRAAAETLATLGEVPVDEQKPFLQVLNAESQRLSARLDALAQQYRTVVTGSWPMADLPSSVLLTMVIQRLEGETDFKVQQADLPVWLHGDSFSLVVLLERLVRETAMASGADSYDLRATVGSQRTYIDIEWTGEPLPAATVESWLDLELGESLGGLRVCDVLNHHGANVWSEKVKPSLNVATPARACVRLPMPPPQRRHVKRRSSIPPRPEFYDFDLLNPLPDQAEMLDQPLHRLSFVVFDTETTGLRPSQGDEVVAIAGVRVVNGRVLTGESFSRFVNPRRPVPLSSTHIHGITDEILKDKPPITVVLGQFKPFVGDSVLVAHNAAFDMKFLKMKEGEAGVVFDNPVLDTLLLSAYLHDHEEDHRLDAIAERFGVTVSERHSAMGDALVTAGIFVRMIDMLAGRGITTLRQATEAANSMIELRRQQAQF